MAEHSRGRQMVFLATQPRYHVAKLLELNEVITVRAEDTRSSNEKDLKIVNYNGKQYHAVLFDSGGYAEMELTRDKLIDYERTLYQYRGLGLTSTEVQTDPETKDIDALTTGVPGDSEENSFIELRSAFDSIIGQPQEPIEPLGWGSSLFDQEFPPETCGPDNRTPTHNEGENMSISNVEAPIPLTFSYAVHDEIPGPSIQLSPDNREDIPPVPDVQARLNLSSSDSQPEGVEDIEKGGNVEKRAYCIFCNTYQTQLPRHLIRAHAEEERVQSFADLPQKDKKRLAEIRKLRLEGYVAAKHSIPVRMGAKTDYLKCSVCNLLYSKRNFYKHYRKCTGKRAPKNIGNIMGTIESLHKQSEPDSLTNLMSASLKNVILPKLTIKTEEQSNIMQAIISDRDLIELGNSLCIRFGNDLDKQQNLIRTKLRTIAKFRIQMAQEDPNVKQVIDIFDTTRWNLFIQTVRKFSKLGETEIEKKSPSNVKHIGLLLSNLAKDLEVTYNDEEKVKTVKRWLKLFSRKYNSSIGWQGNKLSIEKTRQTRKFIPMAEDITKLNTYIKRIIVESKEVLRKGFEYHAWSGLSKAIMTFILCFNRKRVGEVMQITLEDYEKKDRVKEGADVWKSLSESEKSLASQYFHLQIRGKFARPVPLLISNEMAEGMDLVIKYRKKAGVSDDNPFLFAKRGDATAHYDANVVMRSFSNLCGAKRPQDLRSRGYRTHIATVSQALNLSDNDLRVLSGFLGHTTRTHLEHYRMPSDVEHTARLSKLLLSLDSGTIHKYRGKTIDEIQYDEDIVEESHIETEVDDPGYTAGPSTSTPTSTNVKTTPKKNRPLSKSKLTASPVKSIHSDKSTPRKNVKKKWLPHEIKIMKNEFGEHLRKRTLPSFEDCNKVRRKYREVLGGRKASNMKVWIHNQNKKKQKEVDDSD